MHFEVPSRRHFKPWEWKDLSALFSQFSLISTLWCAKARTRLREEHSDVYGTIGFEGILFFSSKHAQGAYRQGLSLQKQNSIVFTIKKNYNKNKNENDEG